MGLKSPYEEYFMKIIKGLAFLTASLITTSVFASNYPADYCQQRVYIKNDGPSVIARVGSGCSDILVIGYKNSGVLASNDVNEIDAVVTVRCNSAQSVSTVKLGREWHGAGYVNKPDYTTIRMPYECVRDSETVIAVAYSDRRGNWDSRYGRNYNVKNQDLYNSQATKQVTTSSYGPDISFESWDVIVNELRN
jgi:hypothetical protein